MKRSFVIALVVTINILFLFIYIYKASQCLSQSYCKQELEQHKKKLEQKKEALVHQLYQIKNRDAIAQFAQKELNMQPIRMSQVKKVTIP